MDKFWERYITSRPAPGESKGAFDAFAAAHRDSGPRNMADGGRIGFKNKGFVTNQYGTFKTDKPGYDSETRIGTGKFSEAELNRVARIKYPEIGNYVKLSSKQKAHVRSALQYSSVAGTKITKKTSKSKSNKDAAKAVYKTSRSSEPANQDRNVWSESRVKGLSSQDWDKFEEAISESVRNGTFVYDLTAGAR